MIFKIKISELLTTLFCLVLLQNSLLNVITVSGAQNKLVQDSSHTKLTLPNPFLNPQIKWKQKNSVREWVFQNRDLIFSDFTHLNKKFSTKNQFTVSEIDWQLTTPGHNIVDLDYRESSLFIPSNVREFLEYKMGRSRYIPIVTLAGAAFLAYHIYQKYGHHLRNKEKEKYIGIDLNEQELTSIKILWQNPGINVPDLYTHAEMSKDQITYKQTEIIIKNLEKKYLVKPRHLMDGNILYFPALSKQELIIKLKDEITQLDGIMHAERLKNINKLLYKLE